MLPIISTFRSALAVDDCNDLPGGFVPGFNEDHVGSGKDAAPVLVAPSQVVTFDPGARSSLAIEVRMRWPAMSKMRTVVGATAGALNHSQGVFFDFVPVRFCHRFVAAGDAQVAVFEVRGALEGGFGICG